MKRGRPESQHRPGGSGAEPGAEGTGATRGGLPAGGGADDEAATGDGLATATCNKTKQDISISFRQIETH